MKKISIIVTSMVLLVAVAGTMQAGAQLSAGVKAGLNLASFDADFEKLKTKPGLVAGGFAAYQFNSKWSAQGEVLYSMQGTKTNYGNYDFKYINIPFTAGYKVWDELRIHTGPQIGLLLSAKTTDEGEKYDIKYLMKSSDISWVLGASYQFGEKFIADVRWVKGLTDVSNNNSDVKNTGVQLTIGYRLK